VEAASRIIYFSVARPFVDEHYSAILDVLRNDGFETDSLSSTKIHSKAKATFTSLRSQELRMVEGKGQYAHLKGLRILDLVKKVRHKFEGHSLGASTNEVAYQNSLARVTVLRAMVDKRVPNVWKTIRSSPNILMEYQDLAKDIDAIKQLKKLLQKDQDKYTRALENTHSSISVRSMTLDDLLQSDDDSEMNESSPDKLSEEKSQESDEEEEEPLIRKSRKEKDAQPQPEVPAPKQPNAATTMAPPSSPPRKAKTHAQQKMVASPTKGSSLRRKNAQGDVTSR